MKRIFICLSVAALLAVALPVASLAAPDSWGLCFHEDGKPPTGNATPDYLAQFDAKFLGDTSQKVMYLTFDAGYENGHTAAILDTLQKHGAPGAFFLVGNYLETAPELVKRMCAEGHLVGNHTFHHPDMSQISSPEAFREELEALEARYKEITGRDMPRFYRPPQGKYNENNLRQAKALGYKTVLWSLAYVDWLRDKQPTREQAFAKLLPRAHPGAIVLLHSTSATNAEILDELLTKWESEGYTFGRIDALFEAPGEAP